MHESFIRQALELSVESVRSGKGGPFGAVLVHDGKVLSTGVNRVTSSNDPTAHAEINAIREGCQKLNSFRLEGTALYSSCEPCPMCLAAIYWAHIGKLYFANTRVDAAAAGFDDQFIYHEISKPIADRSIPFVRLELEDSNQALVEWIRKPDKIAY